MIHHHLLTNLAEGVGLNWLLRLCALRPHSIVARDERLLSQLVLDLLAKLVALRGGVRLPNLVRVLLQRH